VGKVKDGGPTSIAGGDKKPPWVEAGQHIRWSRGLKKRGVHMHDGKPDTTPPALLGDGARSKPRGAVWGKRRTKAAFCLGGNSGPIGGQKHGPLRRALCGTIC